MLLDAVADRLHDLEVDADEVVAAHAGLARHAGRDDDDVGAFDRRIVVGADVLGVEALDRRGLGDVERLALRDAFRDVEEDDVAEFLQADEMGERAADLSGADERDLVAGHEGVCSWRGRAAGPRARASLAPDKPALQAAGGAPVLAAGGRRAPAFPRPRRPGGCGRRRVPLK